ncbi:MAG: YqaA family protein [Akkermansiaceae bacterium]|nr:YqaA family protein [Akkermansiaceae bacterium]
MPDTSPAPVDPKMGWIRRLLRRTYNWTISWADKPGGTWALFFIAFAESSFFPIPPDVLLMALVFGARKKWAKYALVCTAGSVLGGVFGWWIGWSLAETVAKPMLDFFDSGGSVRASIETWVGQWGFWGILLAAITPIPYKVFTVASGVFHYSLPLLIVASIIGRGFRFYMVALVIRVFGPRIRPHLERNLEWWSVVLGLLLIIGVLAVKLMGSH